MADLLVEIRTEEIPARKVREAAAALRDSLGAALEAAGLLDAGVAAAQPLLGTPRRLAAFLPGLRAAQPDRVERLWGPPVPAAVGPDGAPTKAGEGFARSAGTAFAELGRAEKVPGKPPYLFADRAVRGRTAAEVVAEALPAAAAALPFRRTMRWPQSPTPFARPVRGLLVLLGTEVVPCTLAGVAAGRATRGHAFLRPKPFDLAAADCDAYRAALRGAKVLVDLEARSREIRRQVTAARRAAASGARPAWDEADAALLGEVEGLVEWPRALVGTFDARYLRLPPALLVTSMAHHLRFFPVPGADGAPGASFVSVTDRDSRHAPGIRAGNERVLRARLYDADFFFGNDRKRRLEEFRPGLAGTDFHRGLGTLLDKSERVRRVAAALVEALGLGPEAAAQADRAAFLLKCDLQTEVVREFPELQGILGAFYARADGEGESVARALEAQYLPRGEWDPALDDPVAAVVSAAEKTDSLAAYFSAGEEPTGAADPYGLRRHALGLLRILEGRRWPLSLEAVLAPAADAFGLAPAVRGRLLEFLRARAEQVARSRGLTDFVDALGSWTAGPHFESGVRLEALRALSAGPGWKDLVALVERTGNMGAAAPGGLDAGALPPAGRILARALERFDGAAARDPDPEAFAAAYLRALGGPVAGLFDAVLVEDPAEPARSAALKHLLHEVHARFAGRLGDLRRLGAGAKPPRA